MVSRVLPQPGAPRDAHDGRNAPALSAPVSVLDFRRERLRHREDAGLDDGSMLEALQRLNGGTIHQHEAKIGLDKKRKAAP